MSVQVSDEADEVILLLGAPGHGDITEMPDMITLFDNGVPSIVHELICILSAVPAGADTGAISIQEPIHVVMPEVGITNQPDVHWKPYSAGVKSTLHTNPSLVLISRSMRWQ